MESRTQETGTPSRMIVNGDTGNETGKVSINGNFDNL